MPFPSQSLLFALNFFLHPSMLGSLVPSSRFVIQDVMAQVDWDRARVVVEYGPGVGTITRCFCPQSACTRKQPWSLSR